MNKKTNFYYQKYNKKETIQNISCVWNTTTLRQYINNLETKAQHQNIGIENK